MKSFKILPLVLTLIAVLQLVSAIFGIFTLHYIVFYYVLCSPPPDVTSKSVHLPQLSISELRALAEELDNLEINIGNICFGYKDVNCVPMVMNQIQAQVGNGNIQNSGESVAQTQGRKISKYSSSALIELFY